MILTSKEMLESVKKQVEDARKDLQKQKDELENLENQLKVEERILIELKEKKNELVEVQEPIVIAVQGEIAMQKDKINELEMDIKLLAKKSEVLSRNTWNF